jgi:hypothetical protein
MRGAGDLTFRYPKSVESHNTERGDQTGAIRLTLEDNPLNRKRIAA